MGSRGPAPKRDEERRRTTEKKADRVAMEGEVAVPEADPGWHKLVKGFYEGLKGSGQTKFYEPSDWQVAYMTMELLSRELKQLKVSPTMMTVVFSQLSSLGVTEGDRRRMRIEIDRQKDKPVAVVSVLDDYRAKLDG